MENYIRYKEKGEHSVKELEKIIEQREEELHLLRSGQVVLPQANVKKSVCCKGNKPDGMLELCVKCLEEYSRLHC